MFASRNRFYVGLWLALASILGPVSAYGGDIVVSQWGGLNSSDNPATIKPSESSDLLNVNLQPGGSAVYKRDGYALSANLPINTSTTAVHGLYYFQQTGGSGVQLAGNDTELSANVGGLSFVKIATGTLSATWQCTDSLGFAYCVTSSNDTPVKTDGTAANTSYLESAAATVPKGTMITSTPLRLVTSGVANNLSTLYFSAANNFTSFTIGLLTTDPFTWVINAPGSRITHIGYYFGKVFWWKDQSFGYITGTDNQYTVQSVTVSNSIGTLDNSSAFWNSSGYDTGNQQSQSFGSNETPSGIFFRGQDNHIYLYDGYALTRLSRNIAPTVTASSRRKANQTTVTSQADFSLSGNTFVPSVNLSTTVSVGDVSVSSFSKTETSAATGWTLGTASNFAVGTSSLSLKTNNSGNVTNNGFESAIAGNWTISQAFTTSWGRSIGSSPPCGSITAQEGSAWLQALPASLTTTADFQAIDLSNNTLQTLTIPKGAACTLTWTQTTLTPSAGNIGKRVKFRFHVNDSVNGDTYMTTSDSYIWGGAITFYYIFTSNGGSADAFYADNVQAGSSTIATGSFTSQTMDTTFPSSLAQLQSAYTASTVTPYFELQDSGNGTVFQKVTNSTGTNVAVRRYVRYVSSITVGGGDSALSSITSEGIVTASTGTYFSKVFNAPTLTSWQPLVINDFTLGGSTITYYTRSSTSPFYVTNSSPPWVLQGKNATPATSTGTYFQLIASMTVTAATETAKISDFQFNWYEGGAADKAYITYFNDAIWISVSSGTSTSGNNTIQRFDLLNGAWLIDNIPANGFLVDTNQLYFGDSAQGRIFKFGGVPTDNGGNVQSFWKSKDFTGQDPTVFNSYDQSDFIFGQSSGTVTYTYTTDQTTSTAVTINTYHPSKGLVRRGFNLPTGKMGYFYNFKVGDNSSNQAWKLLLHRAKYQPQVWKPETSN